MSTMVCTISHSPLTGYHDPDPEVVASVDRAKSEARRLVAEFDPGVAIVFAPDHHNGFHYELMPAFCVGAQARGAGDFGSLAGDLTTDDELARGLVDRILQQGVDIAFSERMVVDHAFTQPLTDLLVDPARVPIVPIFINCAAPPLGPIARSRVLGEIVGRYLAELDERVLVIGSGGLSHDPPVPRLPTTDPVQREFLITGAGAQELRPARESRTVATARAFTAGESPLLPLNPQWDEKAMSFLANGDLEPFAGMDDTLSSEAGRGAHEVRTWVAAYATALAQGSCTVEHSFYAAVPEWITGFGLTVATHRG